jgi:hypothetical protein
VFLFDNTDSTVVQIQPLELKRRRPDDGSLDLIVSHCREDLQWLTKWTTALNVRNVHVYEKCGQDASALQLSRLGQLHVTTLPNVGREGHTWLHHILRKDILFADWNVFVQGRTESHLNATETSLNTVKEPGATIDFVDLGQYDYLERHIGDEWNCYQYSFKNCDYSFKRLGWDAKKVCDMHNYFRTSNRSCEDPMLTLRGEFLVRGSLLRHGVNRSKLEEAIALASVSVDAPMGHFLERNWIEILSVSRYLDLIGPDLRRKKGCMQERPITCPKKLNRKQMIQQKTK